MLLRGHLIVALWLETDSSEGLQEGPLCPQKRTSTAYFVTSAFGGKADVKPDHP